MLYDSILDTIGNTPLVRLHHIEKMFSLPYHLYAKVESFNPSGSVKARIALMMLKEGLKQGLIDKIKANKRRRVVIAIFLKVKRFSIQPPNKIILIKIYLRIKTPKRSL